MRQDLKSQAAQNNMSIEGLILCSQRQEVKENLCLQIKLSLDFIGNIGQHLDKFEKDVAPEAHQYLLDRLKKYQEYAPLLNKYVEAKHKIDTKLVDSLLEKLTPKTSLQENKEKSLKV